MSNIETLAEALRTAEAGHTNIEPIRDRISDAAEAYAIQAANTQARIAAGGRIVGRKIGLTNPAVQAQLGVDQPDYGTLFADMDVPHGGTIAWDAGAQMKVEAEIAFLIRKDLPNPDTSMGEVIQAIEYALPSLEIVGSRIANWDIKFFDTVADNGSSAFFSLGPSPKPLAGLDLLDCKMVLKKGDEVVSQGSGRACLGSPLNAVQWLARVMAQGGTPLVEGDIVLSGALGPMVQAEPGATYIACIDGLGETSVSFGEAE
jgi:2-keto-4-pentenoate hydratase